MTSENKVLFVTSRNILTTSGELRLIKNRAEALYKYYHIASDFLVWQSKERINSGKREIISAGGDFSAVVLSVSNIPASYCKFKRKLIELLNKNQYSAVILSGVGMPLFIRTIQSNYNKIVGVDIHGSSEDIVLLSRGGTILSKIKSRLVFSVDYYPLKRNMRFADYCFVVTKELRDYVRERFHTTDRTKFIIAPCATDNSHFDKKEYEKNRQKYREKYGFDDSTPVFVYSGGVSRWQCIEETLQLFTQILEHIPKARLLFFSHRVDDIKRLTNREEIIFDSYVPDELGNALCAADFAFLLREDCVTNNVAFPNKYLEYVKSGLKIVTTPYLYEIADQINKYKIGYLYDMKGNVDQIVNYIETVHKDVNEATINQVLALNSFENTLRVLKDGF